MDPTFVRYYDQELRHVRDMGAEFAAAYPGIASRLGMQGIECADPYVERLLEGFAFMAARVQMKIDAQYPVFTRHLVEMLYPGLLAPLPSMAVVAMRADAGKGLPASGTRVPRGSMLRARPAHDGGTPCRYRTAHDVHLLPLTLEDARYLGSPAAIASAGLVPPDGTDARAALRLDFECTGGQGARTLEVDSLDLFLAGPGDVAAHLYEAMLARGQGFSVLAAGVDVRRDRLSIRPMGFDDDEALLPQDERSFSGYRLLREYFACPQRYMFASLRNLRDALASVEAARFSIVVWLDRADMRLDGAVDASGIRLFCTPAINLFHREADRIHLLADAHEFHVLADRTRPMDFEVHGVDRVRGYGDARAPVRTFQPFHGAAEAAWHVPDMAYYSLRRDMRIASTPARRDGPRSGYAGSEVYLSLVDGRQAPYAGDLRQLGMRLLCTNRDLPLHMPVGQGESDFVLEGDAPVASVRCLVGPTWPRAGLAEEASAWKLLTHLQLDHLSLLGDAGDADALRELLSLYGGDTDMAARRMVEGLNEARARSVVRRLPFDGPAMYGRGVEVALHCEAAAFAGTGIHLFGAVMARFLSRYVSLNTFCETVVFAQDRTEVARWTTCPGTRPVL
ncbi:type VI secretion system baseplate subunit TssF [Luteibacter aegosomatis]|uniref:type VI secretion system baseplate subunit TssF n=1 Tax=Luteibacter aegosomatis TaxID=2911537 RepID=UPI001FFBC3AD|nr:type VI secretion system baseplate subunit TssF [Luteibacter aegosomatis]UPG84778.1 type VI secretion system baseplate subunit TssF [Luteibacter aegosomatis]